MSPRKIAFQAIERFLHNGTPVMTTLVPWQKRSQPSSRDFGLAVEMAQGTVRMGRALDELGTRLSSRGLLQLQNRERALLRTALYQLFYMDRLPAYAICSESVEIAKGFNPKFARFLNALLRQAIRQPPQLPEDGSVASMATRYSYPDFYVRLLVEELGQEEAELCLKLGNQAPQLMARVRDFQEPGDFEGSPVPFRLLEDGVAVNEISQDERFYIQNVTPAFLIHQLSQVTAAPDKVLDLCASPGGKSLLIHDLFPEAQLWMNDISERKIRRLKENLDKYQIQAQLTLGPGQGYSRDEAFDLVILDVPCSNSGVLNKRAEARWRLSPCSLAQLEKLQKELMEKGSQLIGEGGKIWWMTCSILRQENEAMVEWACQNLGLTMVGEPLLKLPTSDGSDGGFACCLQKS